MKNISAGLKAHYQQGTTTLATCVKVVRMDGAVFGSTTLDRDIIFDGVTYFAAHGYTFSDIESTAELNADNLEVEGFLGSPAITEADIHSGIWDYAAVEVFEVNYADLNLGRNVLRSGTLGEVRGGRSKFVAELRGLLQAYTRTIGRIVTKDCTADFGDARCKIDLALSTVAGVVDSVRDNRFISDALRIEPNDHFTGAKLTFTSGANIGRSMEVHASVSGQIELSHAMYEVIEPGDTYAVHAGCMKRFAEDCVAKHNNGPNFRGFPHLPQDKIYRIGGVNFGTASERN